MQSCTSNILNLLVACYSAMTSLAMQSGKYLVMTNSSTNTQVCSTDTPSQVLPMCPGTEVQCGMQCLVSSCPYYQFKSSTPIQCELYNQIPWNFKSIANCIGYSPYNQQGSPDCSFPFTLNGVLYTGCVPNGANDACFSVNRTSILCSRIDNMSVVMNNTLSIGNQSSVPVQSIFGWIIWMRKVSSVTFNWNLTWPSYKNGFGSVGNSNYWLGLENLYQLTSSAKYRLRIEVQRSSTGAWNSVEYWSFRVGNEATTKYQLSIDGFSGDTLNGLQNTNLQSCNNFYGYANGMKFTTSDADNDLSSANCALGGGAGWWYNSCRCNCLTVAPMQWYDNGGLYNPSEARMMMTVQ